MPPTRSTGRSRRVLIVGGGTAGITTAARLRRAGVTDVTVLEPAHVHWYQPLWTLVGSGQAPLSGSRRPTARVIPRGVRWVRDAAVAVDPDAQTVSTAKGADIGYDFLVMAPGIRLDWQALDGLAGAVGGNGVTSNYAPNTMLLAEFGYDLKPAPSVPFLDTHRERHDMWLLKRYGLPAMYWHGMLKGRL
jgi:sulfide:quinone oxidoreductase